jgi:hypothetical protein
MTPPATAAARSSAAAARPRNRSSAARSPRSPATAARPSGRVAVRHPRRLSGPARAAAMRPTAAGAAPVALPRVRSKPPLGVPGLALRMIDAVDRLSRSALLERLIRSRVWIGLLAFSLIGIVAMQLLILKLNTDVGHVLARATTLQRENTSMQIADSQTSAGSLVEPTAAAAGMTVAAPGSLHFVSVSRSDLARAASALSAPVSAPPAEAMPASEAQPTEARSAAQAPSASEAQATERAPAAQTASTSEARSAQTTPSGEAAATPAQAAGG